MTDSARKTIADMAYAAKGSEWEGRTPEELLAEWQNVKHAEVHEDGELYIEDPCEGHYMSDDKAAAFVTWLKGQGVTFDVTAVPQ